VAIYVHDTGPGLAPTTLADLFTLLASDPDDLTDAPGSGLGLKLAHRLAKALGGHLAASNTPEGGASFALRVPLQPARAKEAGERLFERLDSGA
jgi:signal transduction histidine kinase